MIRNYAAAAGITIAASLSLAACSGGSPAEVSTGETTLTLSGAALQMAPGGELDTLVKGFEKKYPKVKVKIKEYDSAQFQTLISSDLAAGSATDLIWVNAVKNATTWVDGGQLVDVSDVATAKGVRGLDEYKIGGKAYALPYRYDAWVLFYNKDLFDKAGVKYPDGTWTWDDYEAAAGQLDKGLKAAGSKAKAVYQHSWSQFDQNFATAQVAGADAFKGDYGYMKSYYERSLRMQKDGEQVAFNTIKSNQLHYKSEFGKQNAAMFTMGSWAPGLIAGDIAAGKADTFNWGIAPLPQLDKSTTGLDKQPVTLGSPTAIAINAAIDESKLQAAKDFLAYGASEEGAAALAANGVLPSVVNDKIVDTWFGKFKVADDKLGRFSISTYKAVPDNPQAPKWPAIGLILGDAHTAIMSGAEPIDSALKKAGERVANEVG